MWQAIAGGMSVRMMTFWVATAAILLNSSVSFATTKTTMNNTNSRLDSVPQEVWARLATKKIYFGHQSVGDNILVGVRELLAQHPQIGLRVQERAELAMPVSPVLSHSYVGKNELPQTKNDAFTQAIGGALRNNVDMAFFKYCYVDIGPATDPAALFHTYKKTMDDLKKHNPNVMFIHVTAPLTTTQGGWKAMVKKLLGRSLGGYPDNARRNEFNDLLRKEYVGKEPVFDLAKLEATRPDGSMVTFKYQDREYTSLAPEYTEDGGHLNTLGRKIIAEQLLLFLANQAKK